LQNEISTGPNKKSAASVSTKASLNSKSTKQSADKLCFVFPYGATLNIQLPARPLLSSGPISYPMNRPIAGMWEQLIRDGAGNGENNINNYNTGTTSGRN